MRRRKERLIGERGVNLVLFAISLVVIVGLAGLAIDLGMLLRTRNEAQRAADAAALAGASAFTDVPPLTYPSPVLDSVDTRARRIAGTNRMVGVAIDGATEVVQIVVCRSAGDPDPCPSVMTNSDGSAIPTAGAPTRVLVKIRRAAVPTTFARVFGLNALPVGATAVAEVGLSGGGAKCIVPLALPDAWTHIPPQAGDLVTNYAPSDPVTGGGTGFGSDFRNADGLTRDYTLRILLRSAKTGNGTQTYSTCTSALNGTGGNKCVEPGWWGLWGTSDPVQPNDIESAFNQSPCLNATLGDTEVLKNGWVGSLQNNSGVLNQILANDPNATWPDGATAPINVDATKYPNWINSPRVWTVGLFDPNIVPSTSDKQIQFKNFARIFFEGCVGNSGNLNTQSCKPNDDLAGRFIGPAPGSGTGPGTLVRTLRLVK